MKEIEIQFNINESKEVDLGGIKEKKSRNRTQDDYDYEDPLMELMEDDLEPVELEPHIENFFVYSGKLPEDHKKLLKKYENENKKISIKRCKIANDQNVIKKRLISENKKELEISKNISNDEEAIVKLQDEKKEKSVIEDKMVIDEVNISEKNENLTTDIVKNEVIDIVNEVKQPITEKITPTISANDETTHKKKMFLKEEYFIKNEIIIRNNIELTEELIFEYFTNSLIVYDIKNSILINKKLNLKESKLTDSKYINDKYEELKLKLEIEKIKFEVYLNEKIINDEFYECLWSLTDIKYKLIYLDIFINNKKRIVEITAKKICKNMINDIMGDKIEFYKNWGVKLHYYKKKKFIDVNSNYLNCSFFNSESLFESESFCKEIESIEYPINETKEK